jgi:Flp pilus assembly protein TadD
LEKATALEPQSARHHADLGVALSQRLAEVSGPEQGEIAARMLREFETSVALDPDLVDGYVGLARYYANAPEFAGGSRKRAENYAAEIAKRVPWLGACESGNIAFKFGSFDAALAHYSKADELNPGQAWIKELCARALLGLGRKDEARARLEAVLALEPGRESAKAMLTKLAGDTAQ